MTRNQQIILAGVLIVILMATVKNPVREAILSKLSRGYRNKNPGNLRDFDIPWQGLIGNESGPGSFCVFDSIENGARAAAKDVKGDIAGRPGRPGRPPLGTISKLIAAYAPGADNNNVAAYVAAVAGAVGIGPDAPLSWSLHKRPLMLAIFKHENGYLLDLEKLEAGIDLA